MGALKRLFVTPKPATVVLVVALLVLAGLTARHFLNPARHQPVCVVISPTEGPVRGLESAEYVYEWRLPGGGSQMLAVFTGSDWEAGPVGPLSLGAADIAAMYGRVVCSEVTPQAQELLSRYNFTLPVIYRSKETYVNGADVRSWFAPDETATSEETGYSMRRGRLVGGYSSPTIKGTRSDGSVAFEWYWNGKHYEKMLGTMRVTASAVVVLFTEGGFHDSGSFPNGFFASMGSEAIAWAEGPAVGTTWASYPYFGAPLVLEDWELSGKDHWVRLPKGRIWFEIVNDDCVCSYGE